MYKVLRDVSNKGLFAFFAHIFGVLYDEIENTEDKLVIDLRRCTTYYDPSYTRTDNVFEYFWEQPFSISPEELDDDSRRDGEIIRGTFIKYETLARDYNWAFRSNTMDYGVAEFMKYQPVAAKYFRLLPHVRQKIEDFRQEKMAGFRVLGVHKRGTYHFTGGHGWGQAHLMTAKTFFAAIDPIIDNYDRLFLMTDEIATVGEFQARYGRKLITYDAIRSDGMEIPGNSSLSHNYKIGEDVVVECYLLAGCDFQIVVSSNVSLASLMINGGNKGNYRFVDRHIQYWVGNTPCKGGPMRGHPALRKAQRRLTDQVARVRRKLFR